MIVIFLYFFFAVFANNIICDNNLHSIKVTKERMLKLYRKTESVSILYMFSSTFLFFFGCAGSLF
jgi:hypothetical protein